MTPADDAAPGPAVRALRPASPGLRARQRGLLSAAAVAVAVYYAAFRLPYRWPPEQRLVSPSYAFGFNNLVAILAVAGVLGVLAVLIAVRAERAGEPRAALPLELHDARRDSAPVALAAMVLLYAALTVALYAYTVRARPSLTWESRHFVHRLLLMDLYGARPYTDFHAEYGPALTVTPLYLYRLLRPLGATHEQAYFACHLLLNAAGVACLYYALWRVAMPRRRRVLAFVLLAVAGFGPYMGLNGVLLRYLAPFASLLLGHRAVARWGGRAGSPGRWAALAGVVLVLLGANVLLSPEIGLAFALAWLAYAVLLARRSWHVLGASLAALAVGGVLCRLMLPPPYYASLLRFAEGANNLPLLPAPYLVLYLATLLLVVPPLLAAGLRALGRDDAPNATEAALCGALGALCVLLAPGALGRADPPHVLFYGLGASMLLMARLANASRRSFAVFAGAYGAVHVVLAPVVLLVQFYDVSPRTLLSRAGPSHVAGQLRSAGAPPPDTALLATLDRYPRLGIPFATYGDPRVERYVIARGWLAPEYYIAAVGVYTEAALREKLRDVASHDYLLVPRGYEVRWSRDRCAEYLMQLRRSTLYPARLPCRAAPLDNDGAINAYVVDHYAPVESVGNWLVLGRAAGQRGARTAPVPPAQPDSASRRGGRS